MGSKSNIDHLFAVPPAADAECYDQSQYETEQYSDDTNNKQHRITSSMPALFAKTYILPAARQEKIWTDCAR